MSDLAPQASATASVEGDLLRIVVAGEWRITGVRPEWSAVLAGGQPKQVRVEAGALGPWDSSLALFLREARKWAETHGSSFTVVGLPEGVEKLAALLAAKPGRPPGQPAGLPDIFTVVGSVTLRLRTEVRDIARLVGECAFSMARFFRGQAQFRWRDCLAEMQACGAMALPIVGLISFLVGVIMAYQGAVQLR